MSAVSADSTEAIASRHARSRLGGASWAFSALVHVALAGVALLAVLLSNQPPPTPITVRLELTEPSTPLVEQHLSVAETPPAASPNPPPASVADAAPPPGVPPAASTDEVLPDKAPELAAPSAPQPVTPRPPQPRQVARRAAPAADLPALTAAPAVETAASAVGALPTPPPVRPVAAPPVEPPPPVPPSYAGAIRARLERFKHYPSEARRALEEGTVRLLFTIDRAGRLLNWRLERSSGFELLDTAARDMVERAAPFPPAPDELLGQRFEFVLPVPFVLR